MQYGLYSAFMGCFVYMFFGTSKDVTLGPTAILSLLTDAGTAVCGGTQGRIVCATALTFLSGALQFAVGILNLGVCVCVCVCMLPSPNEHYSIPSDLMCGVVLCHYTVALTLESPVLTVGWFVCFVCECCILTTIVIVLTS